MSEPEEKVKSWLFLTRPAMANGISYSAKIMGMISSSSEDPVLTTITMGLQQLATLFHSWNNQVIYFSSIHLTPHASLQLNQDKSAELWDLCMVKLDIKP